MEEHLEQMHHPWHIQKCELLNKMVLATCPKDQVFCQTMQLADRMDWVTCIDAWGGKESLLHLHHTIGINYLWAETQAWCSFYNNHQKFQREHQAKDNQKRKQKMDQKAKWVWDNVAERRSKSSGQMHGSGIVMLVSPQVQGTMPLEASTEIHCCKCGMVGHWDGRSCLCCSRNLSQITSNERNPLETLLL